MSIQRIILSLLLWIPSISYGQHPVTISFSVFNESTAIPFTRFFTTPVHPGIQIGGEVTYHHSIKSRLFQAANLGYYYHRYLAQDIALSTEFGYEYRLKARLAFSGRLGIGNLLTFTAAEEFKHEQGQYFLMPDKGNIIIPRTVA